MVFIRDFNLPPLPRSQISPSIRLDAPSSVIYNLYAYSPTRLTLSRYTTRELPNIYLRTTFVYQNHRSISYTLVKFSLEAVYTRTNFPCPKVGMTSFGTRFLGKEKLSIFCRTYKQTKLSKVNLPRKVTLVSIGSGC